MSFDPAVIVDEPTTTRFQWHITDRCNNRCSHCYQETYSGEEMRYEELLHLLDEFEDLAIHRANQAGTPTYRGHVVVTGGEPFVREDFMDLLEVLHDNREWLVYSILTNGSLIDDPTARRLAELGPRSVQVSVEGTRPTHDSIRGEGDLDRTVTAAKRLLKAGVTTHISFTAHRNNHKEFPDVARLGMKMGVDMVWSDRLIPCGTGATLVDPVLTPEETRSYFKSMRRARMRAHRRPFCRTEVRMGRALQFLVTGGTAYRCNAGRGLLNFMPNGDVYPCRRMPILVGNARDTPLVELYEGNQMLRDLRDPHRISDGCLECEHAFQCQGGLRCLAYAVTGSPFNADPGCWIASNAGTVPRTGVRERTGRSSVVD